MAFSLTLFTGQSLFFIFKAVAMPHGYHVPQVDEFLDATWRFWEIA